jgi:3-oxoacyl-[acyl-carrier protein] reductase
MKKVFITGATGAIGEACARYFHAQGYFVYIHYKNNRQKALSLSNELENSEIIQFDICNQKEIQEKLEEIEVDVLINNASIAKDKLFFWMEDKDWSEVLETNVHGTYYVTKALLNKMISSKKGSIINVASVSGIVGNMGQTNYAAAKGAMIAFTKSLALELARYKIRVNAVAPGLIKSEMTKKLDIQNLKKDIPMQRLGEPQEVAEVVFFLADKASYVTAEVINISGGMVR